MTERLKNIRERRLSGRGGLSDESDAVRQEGAVRHRSHFADLELFQPGSGNGQHARIQKFFHGLETTLKGYQRYFDLAFSASLQEGVTDVYVANTFGFQAHFESALNSLVLILMGNRRGKTVHHWTVRADRQIEALSPELIAGTAAYELSVSLASKASVSGRLPVLFSSKAASEFLSFFGPSFAADDFFSGRSLFSGRLGGEIASRPVTILNRGNLKGGLGTMPFDAEGSETGTFTLVKNGRLSQLLFDRYQAESRGGEPTGNLICHTFRELPRIAPLNLTIKAGQRNLDALIRETGTGFYLMNTADAGATNPITDRYQMVGSGLMIRQGEKAEPVSGMILSGKLSEMLRNIVAVGPDLYYSMYPGFAAAPALLIDGLYLE
jgi:PmbA protein